MKRIKISPALDVVRVYYTSKIANDVAANRIAKIIVAMKTTFSAPRLEWCAEEKLSPPPNAAPKLASDC
jgi:hypothetical protein